MIPLHRHAFLGGTFALSVGGRPSGQAAAPDATVESSDPANLPYLVASAKPVPINELRHNVLIAHDYLPVPRILS